MRFIDEVTIYVRAGDGGAGCVAFRREAHVPRGGPAGGDGGRGGDVVFCARAGLTTLLDLRYQRHYRAERGVHGQGHDRHGRRGADRVVEVPPGTQVYDVDSGELLADLTAAGEVWVAAAGGRGGRGNARFATPTQRAPREAEPGAPGEERTLRLELKLMADVGLVGLPNAGKSTLIARISAARPKIADYPFTTLVPQLGAVRVDDRDFVIADIPGLIAGASAGAGLGHRFLRHVERTKLLVFLLDDRHQLIGEPGSPAGDLATLRAEISAHDPALAERPTIVAINKVDLADEARRAALDAALPGSRQISAATGEGVADLVEAIAGALGSDVPPLTKAHESRNPC